MRRHAAGLALRGCQCAGFLLAWTFQAAADVRLAGVFGHHMVLQRDVAVPVRGWAGPGEKVTVQFGGQTVEATAGADGAWTARLSPMKENAAGQDLVVTGSSTIKISDVLVGDVWLCSGQSNMGTGFARRPPPLDPSPMDLPLVRYAAVANFADIAPRADAVVCWVVSGTNTVPGYSAFPWFFGQKLHLDTGIPIGILRASWGGATIENWMSPDGLKEAAELKALYRDYEIRLKEYDESLPRNTKLLEDWVQAAAQARTKGTLIPPIPYINPHPVNAPPGRTGYFCMYYGMLDYLTRFPIKGVAWYQGESNADDGPAYTHKLRALIDGWRKAWNQPDLPFYFVQLPSLGGACGLPDQPLKGWPLLREAQARALAIPHTGMAVTIDCGEEDLHPRNKVDMGRRLAAVALAQTYGLQIEHAGPVFRNADFREGKVVLHFDHAGAGLMVGRKAGTDPVVEEPQGKLQEFAVAGPDRRFCFADAMIVGDTVVVSSDKVPQPAAVRYACTFNPAGSKLYGRNGLPAAPFRTDTW